MLRRLPALPALAAVLLVALATVASAHVEVDPVEALAGTVSWTGGSVPDGTKAAFPMVVHLPSATTTTADATTTTEAPTTTERRAGTTLEAEQRDDGDTDMAPWVIGSGLAAAAAIGLGGWFLKQRAS